MKPRRQRLVLVVMIVVGVGIATGFALRALQENLLYFYSPTQVAEGEPPEGRKFRVGGLVTPGSVNRTEGALDVSFDLTDNNTTVTVAYAGILPDLFAEGQKVDVIGTTIGKGYAGTVKRHNFRTQDATHGNSLAHRAPGSIGQNQTPGRVFKGKKMSGQMGNVRRTAQNLEVVRVDAERNVLLIKGAVPGHAGGSVIVRPAIKAKN